MKTAKLFVLIVVSVVMHSCVTNKSFIRNFEKESTFGKEPGSEVFVIGKNGQKVEGKNCLTLTVQFGEFSKKKIGLW